MHPGTLDGSAGLMLQFLRWIDARPRTYGETMGAWRTSCPRISVWEDATLDGLVTVAPAAGGQRQATVMLTTEGKARLG